MTFSKVQDFSPEVMRTPSSVSVMLSIGVLLWMVAPLAWAAATAAVTARSVRRAPAWGS